MADKWLAFGDLLRRYRADAGISQAELAERAGLSARGVSDLERGARRAPHRDTVLRLAEALRLGDGDRAALLSSGLRRPVNSVQGNAPAAESGLPVQLSSLVGRGRELLELQQRLSHSRLLTLTGPGGVGKTRLALEVAAAMASAFPDGTFFVPLDPIGDPALVAPTIAQNLGIRDLGGRHVQDRLNEYLRNKRALVVLDNFERLLAAAPVVSDLLGGSTGVKVLVTSREPLRLRGEHEFAVPPMALPDASHPPRVAGLGQCDAIELFVDRARAINPNFELTPENTAEIAEICIRLDGLPLAIELAAVHSRYLSPRATLGRLEHRLSLLTEGPRDVPPRHKSLRAALDWSYELLDDSERGLFRRLALFVGGSTLEAAESVCGNNNAHPDMLVPVGALVTKSLLRQAEDPEGQPRFRMLETLREYALEQLESSGEESRFQQQFAAYFVTLAERAAPKLLGRHQVEWMRRLDADYDNLRAVLGWSRDGHVAADLALRLVGALGSYWAWWGDIREGRTWAEAVLVAPAAGKDSRARARALLTAGRLALLQDDLVATRAHTQKSMALFRECGDLEGVGRAFSLRAVAESMTGNLDAARSLLEQSVPIARQVGDEWGLAFALSQLASVNRDAGRYDEARALGKEAVANARKLGDHATLGLSLSSLALLARRTGRVDEAIALLRQTLAVSAEFSGVWKVVPRALAGAAWAAGLTGDYVTSARLLGATDAVFEAGGQLDSANWRAVFDTDAHAARAALGDAAFAVAWAEGRAMPLEDAVACALNVRGDVVREVDQQVGS